ncbi:MAG TPA: acyl carrier protein [Candidatus Dormibacteraeota bacterium]|nr:acyl carrier protein [Candidatus Dormibacteraeota bacterium]
MQNNILSEENTKAVMEILVEQLGVNQEQITLDARIEDLGFDSLVFVEIAMALEERFNISIPDERWDGVGTVRGILEVVAELLGGSAAQAA